ADRTRHLWRQRFAAEIERFLELGEVDRSGVDILRVHRKLANREALKAMNLARRLRLIDGVVPFLLGLMLRLFCFRGRGVLRAFFLIFVLSGYELDHLP